MGLFPLGLGRAIPETLLRASRGLRHAGVILLLFVVLGIVPILGSASLVAGAVAQEEPPASPEDVAPGHEREDRAGLVNKSQDDAGAEVQAVVNAVTTPDPAALAEALGMERSDEPSPNSFEPLGDLDDDGVPELALRWAGPPESASEVGEGEPRREGQGPLPAGILFLLAWEGTQWNASRLIDTTAPVTYQVQSLFGPSTRQVILLVLEGANAVPYPVIFQFRDHKATLLWDARAEDSRYQGYAHGYIEFRDVNGDGIAELVVSGRADPGLLVFPPNGNRGFEAKAVDVWDGKAYIPSKTEYTVNQDYTLYRFISALHLHDFRAAYALIDAPRFLKGREVSLEVFRKQMEDCWPEFLQDNIFEAREPSRGVTEDFTFELSAGGKVYFYRPRFSEGPNFLLTGLERGEEK